MGVFNRVMNFMGFGDEEEEVERESASEPARAESETTDVVSEARRSRGTVVSIHAQKTSKVMLSEPSTLEEVKELVEHLRARRVVIVNLQNLEEASALRVVDVLDGAICAFNGKMVKIGYAVFLCAPDNFDINGTIDADKFIEWDDSLDGSEGRI